MPPGTDYAVAFRLEAPAGRTAPAEQWARGVFQDPPAFVRLGLQFGWRVPLRLRLGSSKSPDTVAGWPITESTPVKCLMRADSPLMVASNSAEVDDVGVLWITVVNYRSRLGRILWSLAAPIHQWTLPIFLRIAARSMKA